MSAAYYCYYDYFYYYYCLEVKEYKKLKGFKFYILGDWKDRGMLKGIVKSGKQIDLWGK